MRSSTSDPASPVPSFGRFCPYPDLPVEPAIGSGVRSELPRPRAGLAGSSGNRNRGNGSAETGTAETGTASPPRLPGKPRPRSRHAAPGCPNRREPDALPEGLRPDSGQAPRPREPRTRRRRCRRGSISSRSGEALTGFSFLRIRAGAGQRTAFPPRFPARISLSLRLRRTGRWWGFASRPAGDGALALSCASSSAARRRASEGGHACGRIPSPRPAPPSGRRCARSGSQELPSPHHQAACCPRISGPTGTAGTGHRRSRP